MKVRSMAYVALFAALIAALGQVGAIPLPFTPTPITLQTLGVMLAGAMLGSRLGAASVFVFIGTVAVGFPVLAGGRGGMDVFVSPTAGYLIGWFFGAFVIGIMVEKLKKKNFLTFLSASIVGGILVIYAFGIPVQSFITNIGLKETFISSLIFIPGDLVKVLLSAFIAERLFNTKALTIPVKERILKREM